jgi:hypothetical protein
MSLSFSKEIADRRVDVFKKFRILISPKQHIPGLHPEYGPSATFSEIPLIGKLRIAPLQNSFSDRLPSE